MAGPTVDPRRRPWIAWIVVLAIVIVVVWLITAYANRGTSTTAEAVPGAAPANGAAADGAAADGRTADGHANGTADRDTVTDLSLLARGDKKELEGKKVRLTGVNVESVAGKEGFWISSPDGQRVFVKSKDTRNVSQGKTVNITGKLDQVPDEIPHDWGVHGDQADSMKQLGLYIDADKVTAGTQP